MAKESKTTPPKGPKAPAPRPAPPASPPYRFTDFASI